MRKKNGSIFGGKMLGLILMALAISFVWKTPVAAANFEGYTAISTPQDLADIVNDPSGMYYLTKDIDMGAYGLWVPIDFAGVLDGNGKKISNLTVTSTKNGCAGLFSTMVNATVQNLTVQMNMNILDSSEYPFVFCAGGIVGAAANSIIGNTYVIGTIKVSRVNYVDCQAASRMYFYVGGVAGWASDCSFSKCSNSAKIDAGFSYNNMYSHNTHGAAIYGQTVSLAAEEYVGGIVGKCENASVCDNLINRGSLTPSGVISVSSRYRYDNTILEGAYNVGGIFGCLSGDGTTATNIQNLGTVIPIASLTGKTVGFTLDCGGIVGMLDAKMLYACNQGEVSGTGVGQIVGHAGENAFCNYSYFIMNDDNSLVGANSGVTSSCTTKALNQSGFKKQGSFKNLDFEKTWMMEKGINKGYPFLKSFKKTFTVPKVTNSKKAGTYSKEVKVELSTPVEGATIYYTTDGTKPTTSSKKYTKALTFKKTTTLKVLVVKKGYKNSAISSFKYTIK